MKKINKGLILTLIVLVAVVTYLINVEKQRKEDKEDIKKVCEKFIEFTDKYSVLPKQMQTLTEPISDSLIKEYKNQMNAELEKLMINNQEAVKIQYQILESMLSEGYNELNVVTSQKRKINRISEYEFDGDQVTVCFQNNLERTIKYFDGTEEKTETKSFDAIYDEIILQKVDGFWKVVYSNLQFDENYKPYVEW